MIKKKLVIPTLVGVIGITAVVAGVCVVCLIDKNNSNLNHVWSYQCINNTCKKIRTNSSINYPLSLPACRLTCSEAAGLWPKPTGHFEIGNEIVKVNEKILFQYNDLGDQTKKLVLAAIEEFRKDINASVTTNSVASGGNQVSVNINISDTKLYKLTLNTNESYSLKITKTDSDRILIYINAPTFYGARHGLQTLSQLIIFDEFRNELQIPTKLELTDKPAYPYRGIQLDTSRSFITLDVIKKTIRGMGASKLNAFHWHLTDSSSFPYVSKSHPELSALGAYSPSKIYTSENIKEILEYGRARGVRIIPEFDAPAHVGEGWQEYPFLLCLNQQPWEDYCSQPPCGQFDPTQDELYNVLEDLYEDILQDFEPDIFHMGGDEVEFVCWNASSSITTWMAEHKMDTSKDGFLKLWYYFQKNALKKLTNKAGENMPIMLWLSSITNSDDVLKNLPKEKYIIQIWNSVEMIEYSNEILDNGYKVILSNYDALYLDCGVGSWIASGLNWCNPYNPWHKIYENKPEIFVGNRTDQLLGAEAVLWTEEADSYVIDSRVWPRSAAMAEVFWTNPSNGFREAESRFLYHRERLVSYGINADTVQQEWCLENEQQCWSAKPYSDDKDNKDNDGGDDKNKRNKKEF